MRNIRRWRFWGGLFSFILVLGALGTGHASTRLAGQVAASPLLQNPGFGINGSCSLNGWTAIGSVAPEAESSGNCVARLTASVDQRVSPPREVVSRLEQTFYVPADRATIGLYYRSPLSLLTLRLYNSSGAVVQEREILAQAGVLTPAELNISAYANQYLKLVVEARVYAPAAGAYTEQKAWIDFQLTNQTASTNPGPDIPPGGGW